MKRVFAWLRRCTVTAIRRHPISTPIACLALILIFLAWQLVSAPPLQTAVALGGLLGALVLGFSLEQSRSIPLLLGRARSEYAAVWDSLAADSYCAACRATGLTDEEDLRRQGERDAERLVLTADIKPTDDVLEIGSGVGRLAWALAPRCRTWTGCDVSTNMIRHARARLSEHSNTRFVLLSGHGLRAVEDTSADVIYCTNVAPHLDLAERWRYIADAFRVLRPGGRLYFDTIALDAKVGWSMLANTLNQRDRGINPPYAPLPSVPDELVTCFRQAGFKDVRANLEGSVLEVVGRKPEDDFGHL